MARVRLGLENSLVDFVRVDVIGSLEKDFFFCAKPKKKNRRHKRERTSARRQKRGEKKGRSMKTVDRDDGKVRSWQEGDEVVAKWTIKRRREASDSYTNRGLAKPEQLNAGMLELSN